MKLANFMIASGLLLCLTHDVLADGTFILATGRRDPRIYAIDLEQALTPENNNTPNAIVSRSKVALDRLDGRPLGDPANIVISEDRKTAGYGRPINVVLNWLEELKSRVPSR